MIGTAFGVMAMYAAWQHNPQGVFHKAGQVHWGAWLFVGLSWLGPTLLAAVPVLVLVAVFGLGRGVVKRVP